MATEYFVKLWDNNIIQLGIWQTVYMTALTTIFAYLCRWASFSGRRTRTGCTPTRASTLCSALS